MQRRYALVLVAMLAGSACGGEVAIAPLPGIVDGTIIEVELDHATYRPGDVIGVTLRNRTFTRTFGYNLCSRTFERFDGQDWSAMPPELRLCTQQMFSLPAGEQRTGETDLPAGFPAGTYRLSQAFYDITPGATTSLLAMSAPFTIP